MMETLHRGHSLSVRLPIARSASGFLYGIDLYRVCLQIYHSLDLGSVLFALCWNLLAFSNACKYLTTIGTPYCSIRILDDWMRIQISNEISTGKDGRYLMFSECVLENSVLSVMIIWFSPCCHHAFQVINVVIAVTLIAKTEDAHCAGWAMHYEV